MVKLPNIMTRIVGIALFKSLLSLITFVNCKGSYLVKGFLYNLSHVLMLRVRSYGSTQEQETFFSKISVAKSYLIITDVHSKESKKQVFRIYLPVKLAYEKN